MKKDISANLQQKRLSFCSKILLKVQYNMSLKVLLPWQHTWFQTSPELKAFLATYSVLFSYLQIVPRVYDPADINMLAPVCDPVIAFFELKITNILKSSGWGLEQSELPWEQNFYSYWCVSNRTISLPSFNDLHCKLAKIALFNMYLR